MSLVDPSHPLVKFVRDDRRYALDGYLFVLEALTFAQQSLGMGEAATGKKPNSLAAAHGQTDASKPPAAKRGRPRRGRSDAADLHLTGRQLCEAARVYAMRQYGYLARTVLGSWGITRTDDIGEIVYNMIAIGQMSKTETDQREDFNGVYDFDHALSREYSFASPEADA